MSLARPDTGLELRSLISPNSTLQLSLVEVPIAKPEPTEVLIRVEAAPINPSDLGSLFAGVDLSTATVVGPPDNPVVTAALSPAAMRALAARVAVSMPVGSEGAGIVIEAGSSPTAQALLGKTVALAGGGMYAQYRCIDASLCLQVPDGTPASAAASSFVNPLTALGMVESMRREGHRALIHTAAASNLGQMLTRLCLQENVPLVNIVRKPEQEEILRAIGAVHVCNSTSPSFMDDLIEALNITKATLAFDAIGGGALASQILTAMEIAATANNTEYSRYGSTLHKQVYIYGSLDRGPTILNRKYGMAWGIGGWLLWPFLQTIGSERVQALRQRVAAELQTTFASTYTKEVSLAEALRPEAFAVYALASTGEKYLIAPHKL